MSFPIPRRVPPGSAPPTPPSKRVPPPTPPEIYIKSVRAEPTSVKVKMGEEFTVKLTIKLNRKPNPIERLNLSLITDIYVNNRLIGTRVLFYKLKDTDAYKSNISLIFDEPGKYRVKFLVKLMLYDTEVSKMISNDVIVTVKAPEVPPPPPTPPEILAVLVAVEALLEL